MSALSPLLIALACLAADEPLELYPGHQIGPVPDGAVVSLRFSSSPLVIGGKIEAIFTLENKGTSDFPDDRRRQISPPTIYAWIRAEEARGKQWQRYLRRLGRKRPEREKCGRLPTSVSIEGRPAVVDHQSSTTSQ